MADTPNTPASPKTHGLDPALYEYMVAHGTPPDEIQQALIEETRRVLPDRARMQIAPEQGAFMTMLTRLLQVRQAVEVGTFTGYSALCVARGLAPGGRLRCFDINQEWVDIGRRYWQQAGVADRIEVRIGDAADGLRELPLEPHIDLAFIDADKTGYPVYYEEILKRLAPNGVILVDNVLGGGAVADPNAPDDDDFLGPIRRFNDSLVNDDRVDKVMLGIGDGVTMIRRR